MKTILSIVQDIVRKDEKFAQYLKLANKVGSVLQEKEVNR